MREGAVILLFLYAFLNLIESAIGQCASDESEVEVLITTDNYPSETDWTVNDECSEEQVGSGQGYTISSNTYSHTFCVPSGGRFRFTINDSYGDGICCGYGNGDYKVELDGVVVASGGSFGSTETKFFGAESCDNGTPETIKVLSYVGECSSGSPCGECEGDCDSDSDCGSGLVCFERDSTEQVPGCSGEGVAAKDYCASTRFTLSIEGDNGSPASSFPLKECQGDCDNAGECDDGLFCCQRSRSSTLIPGCLGSGSGGSDYCCNPNPNMFVRVANNYNSLYPLKECQGDCDNDGECEGSLKCFQRSGDEEVPGCLGVPERGWDYCYNDNPAPTPTPPPPTPTPPPPTPTTPTPTYFPTKAPTSSPTKSPTSSPTKAPTSSPTKAPTSSPTKAPTRSQPTPQPQALPSRIPLSWSTSFPLGLCEGDCDNDNDCEAGLFCYQRDGTSIVPGCIGNGQNNVDYCIPFQPNCGTNTNARVSGDSTSGSEMTDKDMTAPCTLYRKDTQFADGTSRSEWVCELDGKDTNHQRGHMVDVVGLDLKNMHETMEGEELISGESTLSGKITIKKDGGHFKAVVDKGSKPLVDRRSAPKETPNMEGKVDDVDETGRRKLVQGSKTLLAIRFVANDASVTSSRAVISDKVFGTSGDNINLKNQYEACSYGKLTFDPPPNDPKIVDGVAEVTVSLNVVGRDRSDVEEDLLYAATCHLGDLAGKFDHVMFCVPPGTVDVDSDGTVGSWIGYAYFNHWRSVFNDDWCNYPSIQLHEIGHNLNLEHAGEGSKEYGDQSGMMGYSYDEDETPVMCFNSAKSWQLGWYSDRHVTVNPSVGGWSGVLIGVANYGSSSETVLIKVDTPSSTDFYVNFNRATGINSGTREGADEVLVTRQTGTGESSLLAELSAGNSYTFPGVVDGSGGAVSIVVNSIDLSSAVATASVTIGGGGGGGGPSSNTLTYIGNNGGSGFPLGLCEGDCDGNSECQSGLSCCERDGFTPIPGCTGTGDENTDYCCNPPAGELVYFADVTSGLQECQGDCDSDSDCVGSLECFQRDGLEGIPGCSGSGEEGVDYCYAP